MRLSAINKNFFFLCVMWLSFSFARGILGQEKTPEGDPIIDNPVFEDKPYGPNSSVTYFMRAVITEKGVKILAFNDTTKKWISTRWATEGEYPPKGLYIKDAHLKKGKDYNNELLILLSDGTINVMILPGGRIIQKGKMDPNAGLPKKVDGDAIYVMTASSVFVNRDTSTSIWESDITGLSNATPNDISLDTLFNVYLATSLGLFTQSSTGTTWSKVSSLNASYVTHVFVDHKNRIFASDFSNVYVSSDNGATWKIFNSGISTVSVTSFGTDSYNNIYVISGGMVYKSDSGTGTWNRIDKPVTDLILDPVDQFNTQYNNINGDTRLFLSTNYGTFESDDQGNTWHISSDGVTSNTLYGFVKAGTREYISTGLGLFYKNVSDTSWTKGFPVNGYEKGNVIYADKNGIVYTTGAKLDKANYSSIPTNWKSTDQGMTWTPDTSGLGVIKQGSVPIYFVDENGVQHYSFSGTPAQMYMKTSNGQWVADTSGYGKHQSVYPNIFASDNKGTLYLALTDASAFKGLLYKRSITGGSWTPDTTGLKGAIIYSLTTDLNGNVYAGTWNSGIYKRTGNNWSPITLPSGLQGNSAFVTALDSGGALFAGFSTFNGISYDWHGVFYTTDSGVTWTYVGLDKIAVKYLVADGNKIYAVTYYDGLYLLSRTGVTEVSSNTPTVMNSYRLDQNYPNPFNPGTVISYHIPIAGNVLLKVYDILGREVTNLVDEYQSAGNYTIKFDGSKLSSGVYFYQLRSGDYVQTKKFMLLK